METTVSEPLPIEKASHRAFWIALFSHTGAIVLAIVIGAAGFWLYSRHNDFPDEHYHPDERTKAEQIMSGERNFHHPLLMLQATDLAIDWFDVGRAQQRPIVLTGRWVSAMFAAIAVGCLTLTGYVSYGFVGLLLVGLTVTLCPPLLIHAHYFKEEPALICGVAGAILGTRLVIAAKQSFTQILAAVVLGIGCGTAISGKYIGLVTVVPALVALLVARITDWYTLPTRILVFLVAAYLTVVTFNPRMFLDWTSAQIAPQAIEGFNGEYEHATDTHYGVSLRVPNYYTLRIMLEDMLPDLWILLAVGLIWTIYRHRVNRWWWVLLLFPISFAVVLRQNVIPIPRYALPITLCVYFIAAMLIAWVLTDLPVKRQWIRAGAMIAVAALIVGFQGYRCWDITREFGDDTRQHFRQWVAENIPAGVRIASDSYTGLPGPGDVVRHPDQKRMTQSVGFQITVADLGTIDSLLARGVRYVAVANMNFERYFDRDAIGGAGEEARFKQNRQFYQDIFDKGKLLWESHPKYYTGSYVGQDLRLYDISQIPKPVAR